MSRTRSCLTACAIRQPGVLGLHVVSDSLIALAYFSIPFTLLYFVRHRTDLSFNWIFVCFAIFIVACGTTHVMEIWTVWQPHYWLSADQGSHRARFCPHSHIARASRAAGVVPSRPCGPP